MVVVVYQSSTTPINTFDVEVDVAAAASGTTWTSGTFSTSQPGVIVCAGNVGVTDPIFTNPGTIGGQNAPVRQGSTGPTDGDCAIQDLITTVAQTNITATMTWDTSGTNEGTIAAFYVAAAASGSTAIDDGAQGFGFISGGAWTATRF